MLERMIHLLRENDSCVLATCSGNKPHCSLMTYVADEPGRVVFMITLRRSRKFQNMRENQHVSFLVDTRGGRGLHQIPQVSALTVFGTFRPLHDRHEREAALNRLLELNPHLAELADQPDAEVFSIVIESFLLLEGVAESSFVSLR